MGANREYKSSVFTRLFSETGALLELYNALSGSNYGADTIIEINTLEDVLFMDLMNDISFTVDDKIVILIEHMSTISENLPLRLLLYMARVYEKIIDKRAVYKQKLFKIPAPELIVLYNGKMDFPEEKELRLSDAFKEMPDHPEKYGSLDLSVRILNINVGHNESIVQRSSTLQGFVTFVGKVRDGIDRGLNLAEAITEAVEYCEEHQILQPFLSDHSSEVVNMLTTEFNLQDAILVWREEGLEEGLEKGREKGREEGREEIVLSMLRAGMTPETIAELTSLSLERIKDLAE